MKHKVKITGILKKNGQMAYYGEIVDDDELIDPANSIKDGFTIPYSEEKEEGKAGPAADDLIAKAKGKAKAGPAADEIPPVEEEKTANGDL